MNSWTLCHEMAPDPGSALQADQSCRNVVADRTQYLLEMAMLGYVVPKSVSQTFVELCLDMLRQLLQRNSKISTFGHINDETGCLTQQLTKTSSAAKV